MGNISLVLKGLSHNKEVHKDMATALEKGAPSYSMKKWAAEFKRRVDEESWKAGHWRPLTRSMTWS